MDQLDQTLENERWNHNGIKVGCMENLPRTREQGHKWFLFITLLLCKCMVKKLLNIYTRCVTLYIFAKTILHKEAQLVFNLQVHNYITQACIWDKGWYNRWMLLACKKYDNGTHEIVCAYCNYIFSTKVHERTHETWHKESTQRKCKEGLSRMCVSFSCMHYS